MQILNFDGRDPYFYNPIINGNMDFWQRGQTVARASTTTVPAQGRLADRHATVVSATTAKQLTINRSTSLPTSLPTPAQYSMEVINNTAVATLAAADYVTCFEHVIEGTIFAPLQGDPLTLGFWMFSSLAGAVPISIRYGTSNSFVTSVTATAGWAYYTVSIAAPNFTMPVDNTATLDITIGGFCGTTFQTATLNAWQVGNFLAPATQMAFLATANNTLRFAQVQLRAGTLSAVEVQSMYPRTGLTPAGELVLCQRYFEKSQPLDVVPGTASTTAQTGGAFFVPGVTGVQNYGFSLKFAVAKRTTGSTFSTWDLAGNPGKLTNYNSGGSATSNVTNSPATGVIPSETGLWGFVAPQTAPGGSTSFLWAADADF
jgi:hypothetical protein